MTTQEFDRRHNSLMDWGPDSEGDHPELGHYGIPTVKGNFDALPQKVQDFIDENVSEYFQINSI